MDRAAFAEQIADTIISGQRHPLGMAGLLIDNERAKGGELVQINPEDWEQPAVIMRRGNDVRIVAIRAARRGEGAFRRLVYTILSQGLTPVVVEPVGVTMPAVMRKWRWMRRVIGHGWESVEEWRPRRSFILRNREVVSTLRAAAARAVGGES